ncbi:MAG: hypothetical protein PXY39_02860 [archaeon]|nr:hypothetical protein [archaeon]
MNLRERRIVGISIFVLWLILLLAPVIPTQSGQYNSNYYNTCTNPPPNYTCGVPDPEGVGFLYHNGTSVSPDDCSIPNAICVKWTTYVSPMVILFARTGLLFPAGFEYTVNPQPCDAPLCGLVIIGYLVVGFVDFILVVIPLWILIRKIRNPTVKNSPATTPP